MQSPLHEATPGDGGVRSNFLPRGEASRYSLSVAESEAGQRLDLFLARQFPERSRSALQHLIDTGRVLVEGEPRRRSHKLKAGESVVTEIPMPLPAGIAPEPIPLQVLYEDHDLAVINKPAGIIVHPGAGRASGTLAAGLLHRFGTLSSVGGPLRPGIVHRLDKGTSGVLIVARTDVAHRRLVEQFQAREVKKTYVALVHGSPVEAAGRIELPVGRDLRRRARMTARRRDGREARTDWRALLQLGPFTLMEADLHTGRTHQLRVHFSAIGHPIVGDTLYGAPRELRAGKLLLPSLARPFLHAAQVRFTHPLRGTILRIKAPLPGELRGFLRAMAGALGEDALEIDAALETYS